MLAVTAYDADGNGRSDTIEVTCTPGDIVPPSVVITTPPAPNATTSAASMSIAGNAEDDVSVVSVTWANGLGGSGTCSGTSNWNVASVPLARGVNVITVTAKDAAGNTRSDTVTVTRDATITVVTPKRGNVLAGSSWRVQWSSGNLNPGGRVHVYYSVGAQWEEIAELDPTATSCVWTVPDNPMTGAVVWVGNAIDGDWETSDQSDQLFSTVLPTSRCFHPVVVE